MHLWDQRHSFSLADKIHIYVRNGCIPIFRICGNCHSASCQTAKQKTDANSNSSAFPLLCYRKVTLTEEGMILRKRAEETLNPVHKTEREISLSDEVVVGDVYIETGETDAVRLIAKAAMALYQTIRKKKKTSDGIQYRQAPLFQWFCGYFIFLATFDRPFTYF